MSLVSVDDVSYGYLPPDLNSSPFSDGPAPDRQTAEQLRGITMTIEPGTSPCWWGRRDRGSPPC